MPIHDWTRVDAGTFHAFHTAWVTHLSEMLKAQFGMIADQVMQTSLSSSRGASEQIRVRSLREGVAQVKTALEKAGVKIDNAEVAQVPKVAVDVDEETGKKLVRLMEALDDHDDVQNVYTNANLTEAMMAG